MGKSNTKKRHRLKPVYEMIDYYTNILKIVADGKPNKSENEICNALKALHKEGLNYKRDAIDAIHILSRNQILKISKSENHPQRNDVQLAPLGDELVSLCNSIERSITDYKNLEDTIKKCFVVGPDTIHSDVKAKLLSKNWKLEEIPFHDQWLEKILDFMVKTPFVIIMTLITSYMRLLPKIYDNEPAKAILNYIFAATLKQGLLLPIIKEDNLINKALAQMEPPIAQYFVDYYYDKDIHENRFLEGKPQNLLNSIHSIIEPGKDTNFNNLLNYVLMLKEKSLLSVQQDLPPP
jgi:hypothetical protein